MSDAYTQNHTDQQLEDMRQNTIIWAKRFGREIDKFTCDECPMKSKCEFVFDGYNTDGDCLMDK